MRRSRVLAFLICRSICRSSSVMFSRFLREYSLIFSRHFQQTERFGSVRSRKQCVHIPWAFIHARHSAMYFLFASFFAAYFSSGVNAKHTHPLRS
nr:MAG TPA: hypothetical protein [Caudoviricetes sp.]